MKTSIKSNLFFITYGIFLSFIVGLIVLSNTYLEAYYRNDRKESLLLAFDEVKDLDLTSEDLHSLVLGIENSYNISIQILKETEDSGNLPNIDPGNDGGFSQLPLPYERIYGNQFSIRDSVIVRIMSDFQNNTLSSYTTLLEVSEDYAAEGYTIYTANLTPNPDQGNEDFQMLSLLVEKPASDGFHLYYILTVTIQSIQDSVRVFNSFTILVAVIFMFVSALIVYFASYKFTNPILQITDVTRNMANLDFSQKLQLSRTDELGVLGDSIDKMSTQLESSIQELRQANLQLSQDIELKTKIDDMRKEFIASASHELKTPISLILGYSEALKLPDLDSSTIEEYLDIIIDESNKMNKLVMGMLKLSQLEGGFLDLNISKFHVKDLIEETCRLFKVKFDEAGVHLSLDTFEEEIESDYDQLQTVLSNFIANALHHLNDKKRIRISMERFLDGSIAVNVFNSGSQIPESDIDRIWESFYKVDKARTRSYGGQGLGLSIVRNTLDQLGYRYGAKNEPDGVTFQFIIPHPDIKPE